MTPTELHRLAALKTFLTGRYHRVVALPCGRLTIRLEVLCGSR